MKVLDVFCGMGGWSLGFAEVGFEPTGIDIVDWDYPFKLFLQDVRRIDGYHFQDFDVIIGSPPCRDFSTATQANKGYPSREGPNPERGLELIHEFMRIIDEAQPKFWAFENVQRLEKFYEPKPIWRFYVSVRGKRSLWGNIPLPLMPDFRFPGRNMEFGYLQFSYKKRSALRSKIPIGIARAIAQVLRSKITISNRGGEDE